jgi:hypothetical protein
MHRAIAPLEAAHPPQSNTIGMGAASDGHMRLWPVTFRYKNGHEDASKPLQYGLIGGGSRRSYSDLVSRSTDGQNRIVRYQLLDQLLLNELHKQHAIIEAQKTEIRAMEERLAKVDAALSGNSAEL